MDRPIRAASYARTSTVLKQDPALQHVSIKEYAKQSGMNVVACYTDQITGTSSRRPALDQMLAASKRGEFDVIIIQALDRLGRSSQHLIGLVPILRANGVGLISLREQLDLNSPSGRAFFGILSILAELDREIISERIRSALQSKKILAQQSGSEWKCGRPRTVKLEHVQKVNEMRLRGMSVRAISKVVGLGKTTVERILRGKR